MGHSSMLSIQCHSLPFEAVFRSIAEPVCFYRLRLHFFADSSAGSDSASSTCSSNKAVGLNCCNKFLITANPSHQFFLYIYFQGIIYNMSLSILERKAFINFSFSSKLEPVPEPDLQTGPGHHVQAPAPRHGFDF